MSAAVAPVETLREWLPTLQAIRALRKYTRIEDYYPDAGPYRRELYPKHVGFFNAGLTERERAALGGNRCITPWTPVETDHAMRQCGELIGGSFGVRSVVGGSRCSMPASPVFLKGIEPAFRLHLDNGQWFDCTRRHRVQTTEGWLSLDQIVQHASGLHCWGRLQDSSASYVTGDCLCGGGFLRGKDSVSASPPLPANALAQSQTFAPVGAVVPTLGYIHTSQGCAQSSIVDDPARIADLCAQFEDPGALLDAQWCSRSRLELSQFAYECGLRKEGGSRHLGEWGGTSGLIESSSSVGLQSAFWCTLGLPVLGWLSSAPLSSAFFPYSHCSIVGGNRIVSIVSIGYQPILDFEVRGSHCYESGGVIHHNSGKTTIGAFEVACHVTGQYPDWWLGRRFDKPVLAWVAGDTSTTVKEIIQPALLGPQGAQGTGMIPGAAIARVVGKQGVSDAVGTAYIRHSSGGQSVLGFKSYDQRRESFQGTGQHVIWLDEECPEDIYTECLMRTMTTDGRILLTFTPLMGLSDVVLRFLPGGDVEKRSEAGKFSVLLSWDECPHLTVAAKAELLASIPAFQRDARTKGIPQLGSGAIYPVPESDVVVADFAIPEHWPRAYGMDVGWNRTAAVWGAWDRETNTVYLYSEHYRGEAEPVIHAEALKARGTWIGGVIDPAAKGRSQKDGTQLISDYQKLGLDLRPAMNAVEAGLFAVWSRLSSGKLRVFSSLQHWREEYRLYRRDENGKVVKEKDHLMDSTRYLIVSGLDRMMTKPKPVVGTPRPVSPNSWMG